MKNILIAFILLFYFQIDAQIPDSLNVDLPWEIVNLPDCASTMGEGPISNSDSIAVFLDSDSFLLDENDECLFRMRSWQLFDWVNGVTYEFNQLGKVKDFANTHCESELYLNYTDFPVSLHPDNLLLELDPSHEYAFSYSDATNDHLIIDSSVDDNFEVYVYDLTDNTICKTNVYVTFCEEDINFVFPEIVEIEFNSEPYFDLTLDMLGVNIVYPCGTYTSKITVGQTVNSLLFSQNVGNIVPVKVEIEFSDGVEFVKYIDVNVTGVKPPPIPMFIEEVEFTAGETIELDIWSEEVPGLIAWQLQLKFQNVEIIEIETSEMFEDVPYNILDVNTLRALWFPSNGVALDAESNATWYTMILKPEVNGNTFDIFTTGQDPWSKIAIEDDNYVYEYEADFIFNVAPRNILGTNDPLIFGDVDVFPNPVSDLITIKGMKATGDETEIAIFDLQGRIIMHKSFSTSFRDLNLDVSNLQTGLFILKIQSGASVYTQKINKI